MYIDYSMSARAADAYANDERPISRWRKTDIMRVVRDGYDDHELSFTLSRFAKLPLRQLRGFLRKTSWHHTGLLFNQTDFYSVDFYKLQYLTDQKITEMFNGETEPQKPTKPVVRKCHFLTWTGTRKHPRAVDHIEVCPVVGNWAHTSVGRKSIHANGFYFIND